MQKEDSIFELPKAYEPKVIDEKWYSFWENGNFFQANAASNKPPYTIVMPPPNVTGVLHMGHALVNTLQDILIRFKRMQGYEALWVPGIDHAGIATQTVVERHLLATQGKRRNEYERDEFLKYVWEWKEKSKNTIFSQLKKLGCSCDWSRLHFTMDATCNRAVKTMFKKMFDAGLIYRGDYLVNWDPVTQTALADDEVEYEEREGFLWYFKYHLVDGSGYLKIATTRPETMLGDTAVAVSPKDPRYQKLIGQKVHLPISDRELPIIADHHVDPDFGTGIVKITPAHDPNDYRMGLDHNLSFINILTPDGRINENGGPFAGMSREEAREAVVEKMRRLGLLDKVERHLMRVGVSYRSKAVIEPYLSKQWFVKMSPFVNSLKSAVHEKEVTILPKNLETTYFHWVNNLRDWCISRQLWWGHRIPIWYRKDAPEHMICHDGEGDPPEVAKNPDLWKQDPDVLDTWFSSALWPFSTLGWPEKTADLEKFYPTSVLITGHDILFFWVARMILMGKYALGQCPFSETFLHGLIYGKSYFRENKQGDGISYIVGEEKREYDLGKPLPKGIHAKWEKLSKSKGNVIDPLELIEEYGTDAVRMTLCSCANQSSQIDLDRRKFEEFKNFANKMWNGARFIFMNIDSLSRTDLEQGLDEKNLSLEDLWILSTLNRVTSQIAKSLESYGFDQAAELAYKFFWNEFCAYYLEIAKPVLFKKSGTENDRLNKQKLLVIILCSSIRLLHPMAPFITEELFQLLKKRFPHAVPQQHSDLYTQETLRALQEKSCVVAPFPTVIKDQGIRSDIEQRFSIIELVVYTIRNIRGEMGIPPGISTDVFLTNSFKENPSIIQSLVKTEKVEIVDQLPDVTFAASGIAGDVKILIPLPKELAKKELTRLEKERSKLLQNKERIQKLFDNPEFLGKANPVLIEKQKQTLQESESQIKNLSEKIHRLSK